MLLYIIMLDYTLWLERTITEYKKLRLQVDGNKDQYWVWIHIWGKQSN